MHGPSLAEASLVSRERCLTANALLPAAGEISPLPLRAGPAIEPRTFATIRRRAVLDGCKWDPQVGDVSTLAAFPLLMRAAVWRQLAAWAEQLTTETLAAEAEMLEKPQLLDQLGLPRSLRQVLRKDGPLTPAAARAMRFDFHFTTEGWRISEVNSDVPGGFTESSYFTAMIAKQFPALRAAGDPAEAWLDAVTQTAGGRGVVALLAAPGYMEDQQIMAYLAARLRERGCFACLANPTQIAWRDGAAHVKTSWHCGPADSLVRFYQGEWLARLPKRFAWEHFFRGGRTPVANPGVAVLSESKRFPLLWDRLTTSVRTWRTLLPETREARDAPWPHDDGWLVKSALSNTGDDVSIRALLTPREWRGVRWAVRLQPGRWLAQRRFESLPIETPLGSMHACVGVYTIDGRAGGAYGRLAHKPVIDYAAVDAALLLEGDDA
jgi:glutathionylspermidine synthase